MKQRDLYPLSAISTKLEAALWRLKSTPTEHKPFVIVSDTLTGRFVQFRGSARETLLLDLPVAQFKSNLRLAKARNFLEFKGMAYQRDYLSPEGATSLAMRVMREIHDLPENAQIEILEETSTPVAELN